MLTKKILFFIAFVLWPLSSLHAQLIQINEICSINYICFEDDTYDHGDWVEFYNPGSSDIDLGGMYLTDNMSNLVKFQIPTNNPSKTTIESHDYLIFWFDEDSYKGATHASFKLNNNGESIALIASDGVTIIDSISFGKLHYDVTYGRKHDGSQSWRYFPEPTPDDENSGGSFLGITGKPDFSVEAGFYTSSLNVEINFPDSDAKIYYTLDGSDPSHSTGSLYDDPIEIDENTVLRARAFKTNYIPGEIITRTYFINRTTDLPILSVVTDPENLWDDETGIYTFGVDDYDHFYPYYGANFWHDWKRVGHIELFEANGAEVVSQNLKISITGNTSRVYAQKSMNFEADDALGKKIIPYQLFPQLPIYNYKSFKVRNGGSDWSSTGIRDAFNHTILEGATDVDHQSNRPVIMYLNGDYWGIINMTEKIDEDYLNGHYPSIDKDSIDLLFSNAEPKLGDSAGYNAMINFITNNPLSQQSNYNYIKDQIDIQEFINYFQTRIYYASTDWPYKNIYFWRPQDLSRKWRWIMWDTDRSDLLTRDPSKQCSYDDNTLEWATTDISSAAWSQFLLNSLLTNNEFESQFITQYAHHINFTFCPIRTDSVLNVFRNRLYNELPAHINRWKNSNDTLDYYTVGYYSSRSKWNTEVDTIKRFFNKRQSYMRTFVKQQFGISGTSELSLQKFPSNGGIILIDTFPVPDNSCDLIYFDGYPVTLTAVANPGYIFAGWTNTSGDTLPITWIPDDDTTVSAFFILTPTQPSSNITMSVSNCSIVNLNWTPGSGEGRIVIAKASSPVNSFPADLNSYSADSVFGNGFDLGSENYVVYSGTDSSCSITGFLAGINYFIAIIEFNEMSGNNNYNTSNYLSLNTSFTTPQLFLGNDISICAQNSLLLDAGPGLSSYLWSTGATTQTILVDSTGKGIGLITYAVTGTNSDGCSGSDDINVSFDICSVIKEDMSDSKSIRIYPNPFSDMIKIFPANEIYKITFYDAIGKMVLSKLAHSGNLVLPTSLIEGIYFVRVESQKEVKIFKLIKEVTMY